MTKWGFWACGVALSVITVGEVFSDCVSTWRDWTVLLIATVWWQYIALHAWVYWRAVEDRGRRGDEQ